MRSTESKPVSLTYTAWKTKVDANQVKTATINDKGGVSGELTDKKKYTSRIPTAIPANTLLDDLTSHQVTVKATTTGTSILSIIGGLLPLILLLGIYLWISPRAARHIGGGGAAPPP